MFVDLIAITAVHQSLHQSLLTKSKWQFLGVGIRDDVLWGLVGIG
jgi:hypothetical protein